MFSLGSLRTMTQGMMARSYSVLGHLAPAEGATTSYKRLGRGPASGKGKTSGRGQKGQKARGKVPRLFEGGQTPFWKRFPITGFKRPHRKVYHELTLARIQEFWDTGRIPLQPGETLTIKHMRDCGLLTGTMKDGVKVLARTHTAGYTVPLNIEASKASLGAIDRIEKSGNSYTSVYYTKLGLQAHLDPERFLLKKGYVPLQARPTHRRDIGYYSNEEKRGYLLKDRSILLDHLGANNTRKVTTKKSALQALLESASTKTYDEFHQHKVVSLKEL